MTGELGADDALIELEATQGTAGVGRVIEAGERARALLDRRVLVGPIDPCGECEICRRGGGPVCPTARRRDAWVDRVVANARWLVTLEGSLDIASPAAAAIAGDLAIAYTMYARTGVGPSDRVVIAGASPVTRFLVEVLTAKGIAPVVVADPAATAWCAWLDRKAAGIARSGGDRDARAAVEAAFAARMPGQRSTQPWRILASTPSALAQAAALAGPRATLTVRGPCGSLPSELVDREVTVIGVAGAHPDLMTEVAAMCCKGEIDLAGGTAVAADDELRAVVSERPRSNR
ncbi:MAG: alcohol dehydrogenase catalytic domain-containing protein [Kofleriaceae bacterium]